MNTYNVEDIADNAYFTDTVLLDKSFILTNADLPFTASLKRLLQEWQFTKVYSQGIPGTQQDTGAQSKTQADSAGAAEDSDTVQSLQQQRERIQNTSPDNCLQAVSSLYNTYLVYIRDMFSLYATHEKIDKERLFQTAKELALFIKQNKNIILQIQVSTKEWDKDFLVIHTMRTCIYAISIALQLRLPWEKVIELCAACLLHELGMLRLPPQLYLAEKALTPKERQHIATHPIITYQILKKEKFPDVLCVATLEHHEKENGTGYPRKIMGEHISLYAKIIAVACAYEAITTPRPYKQARNGHEAMVEMLKNTGHQYDETVIKALLFSLSLYPIGSYAVMSDGTIAHIIDVNPDNPKLPIVEILGKTDSAGNRITYPINQSGPQVIRILTKDAAAAILKKRQAAAQAKA